MTRFIVVPQWQGSPSSRAMQLIDGAQAIAGDLPRAATVVLDVPMEAGEALGTGVRRLSALLRTRALVEEAVASQSEPVLVVGGDCGIAVPAVANALQRHPTLAVVWIDAHPDLHSDTSTPSGAFGGMALRAIVGEGVDGLALAPNAVAPSRVVLTATRSFDPAEEDFVAAHGILVVSPDQLSHPDALARAVEATGADAVYIHVDLDALDPSEIAGTSHAEPFGVAVTHLTAAIARLRAEFPLAGASIAGYSPASPDAASDDLGAILRIIGALV